MTVIGLFFNTSAPKLRIRFGPSYIWIDKSTFTTERLALATFRRWRPTVSWISSYELPSRPGDDDARTAHYRTAGLSSSIGAPRPRTATRDSSIRPSHPARNVSHPGSSDGNVEGPSVVPGDLVTPNAITTGSNLRSRTHVERRGTSRTVFDTSTIRLADRVGCQPQPNGTRLQCAPSGIYALRHLPKLGRSPCDGRCSFAVVGTTRSFDGRTVLLVSASGSVTDRPADADPVYPPSCGCRSSRSRARRHCSTRRRSTTLLLADSNR
jgi:hypothetical protein